MLGGKLFYLVYKSKEASAMSITQIKKLANTSSINNSKINVTGLLIRIKGGFIEYLEGNKIELLILYEKILRDNRHHSLIVLKRGFITKRRFDKWSMILKNISPEEAKAIEKGPNRSRTLRKAINNQNKINEVLDTVQINQNLN